MLWKNGFSQFGYLEGFELTEIALRGLASSSNNEVDQAGGHEFPSVKECRGGVLTENQYGLKYGHWITGNSNHGFSHF